MLVHTGACPCSPPASGQAKYVCNQAPCSKCSNCSKRSLAADSQSLSIDVCRTTFTIIVFTSLVELARTLWCAGGGVLVNIRKCCDSTQFITNGDINGFDYNSFHNTDASACCAKCAADARCSGFEVVTGGGDLASGSSADCYLKDWHTAGTGGSPSGPRPVQGSYNNRILGYNTRSASCDASKFITNGNINGFDYATFHNSGPADCCAKCAADPRCSGFGVVTGGGDLASGSSADCYLKDWHATTSPTPLAKPVQSTYPDRVLGYMCS